MEEKTKQENGKKKFVILLTVIIAIILGGIYFYIQSAYVSTNDAYVDTTTVQVSTKVSGQLVEVLVNDNEQVKEGAVSKQEYDAAKASMFPPGNAVGSFVKIVQRIPVKIIFTDISDQDKAKIVSGMSVVPKVKIRG